MNLRLFPLSPPTFPLQKLHLQVLHCVYFVCSSIALCLTSTMLPHHPTLLLIMICDAFLNRHIQSICGMQTHTIMPSQCASPLDSSPGNEGCSSSSRESKGCALYNSPSQNSIMSLVKIPKKNRLEMLAS